MSEEENADDAAADATSAAAGAATSGKRKRVVLSIIDKQAVLARLAAGETPAMVAGAFDISRQQISDIKKNRERILAICADARQAGSLRRKTLTPSSEFHPGVEQALYRWLVRQRRLGRVVSCDALAAMASDLFLQFATDTEGISFKMVANWLRHFKRAHGLKALSDDELARLPDRFVPAMDMAHGAPGGTEPLPLLPVSAPAPASRLAVPMRLPTPASSSTPIAIAVDDDISGLSSMMALHAAANPLPHQHLHQRRHQVRPQHMRAAAESSRHPLVSSAVLIQEIAAQLAHFEQEMAAKLDDLDARVEKLCFLVLPPRLA